MYNEGQGVIKHYFPNIKKITKVSIEEVLDDLLVKKRRTELDATKDEFEMNSLSSK